MYYSGITVEVNLHKENEKHFIKIVTLPYSVPISLRGRYYNCSGITKQELTGAPLNEFLLKRSGKTWDDVVEPRATFDDIDVTTVAKFLVMTKEKGQITNKEYQELNNISKATSTRDLTELVEHYKLFNRKGEVGAGTHYFLNGS